MHNRRLVLQGMAIVAAATLCLSNALAQSSYPNPDTWVTDGIVYAIAQSGNTTYIGGNFDYVGPNTGCGVLLDAATGQVAVAYPKVNGYINAVVPDGTGGWYIGGSFTQIGEIVRHRIAHILADGTVDSAWNPAANDGVSALLVSADGTTLYVGGDFTSIGGQLRNRIAALDAVTGNATVWEPDADDTVHALAVSADGATVYAGGSFTGIGGQPRNCIAALDAVTGLATAWNPDATNTVSTLALSADGMTVYAGGAFTNIGGQPRNYIAALNVASGSATGWAPDANGIVNTLVVREDIVYAGGSFTSIAGVSRRRLAALDAATGMASSWDPSASNTVYTLTVSLDGSTVYVGGLFRSVKSQTRNYIAAVDATTGIPTTWEPNASSTVYALAVSPDDSKLYAGGRFSSVGGKYRRNIAALDTTTGTAKNWTPNPEAEVYALVVSADGSTVYVGGLFLTMSGQSFHRIAALDATTGLAKPWDPNASGRVRALALSPDSATVYAGGEFTSIGGQTRNRIAALDVVTGQATAWNPDASNTVNTLAVSPDSTTVYTGGVFTSIGGQTRNRIAALDAATGNALDWNPDSNGTVFCVMVPGDGAKVYAGGGFTNIGGQTHPYIVALDGATGNPTGWAPSSNGSVRTLACSLDGTKIYAGGAFTSIGGQIRNRIAALDAVTGNATSWNPNADYDVYALAVSENGRSLCAGGGFSSMGVESQRCFAQFEYTPAMPRQPGVVGSAVYGITWTWKDISNNETGFKVYAGAGVTAPLLVTHTTSANVEVWMQGGLDANRQYAMQVAATNEYGDSAKTATITAWTMAATPAAPVVQNATATTVNVAVGVGDDNPSYTEYALYCVTTGQWVQSDGILDTEAVWRTATSWGTITVVGLNDGSRYNFRALARNVVGAETAYGPIAPAGIFYWQLTYTAGANGVIQGDSPQIVSHGGNGTPVTAVANPYYYFVQWSDGRTDNPRTDLSVMAAVNVEAIFMGNSYTVVFDAQGGNTPVPSDKQVNFDSAYGALAVTSRTGYVFDGWFTASTGGELVTDATVVTIVSDHTLYAQWTILSYTLNYAAGANGTISGDPVQVVPYGSDGTSVTAVPDAGYHFVQWSDGRTDNPRTDLNVAEDISVEAIFAGNTCTVTFDAQGGSAPVPLDTQVTFGSAYGALAVTSRTGYVFDGWFTLPAGGELVTEATVVTIVSDHTLYAQWTILSYTLNYAAGANGTISGDPVQVVPYGGDGTSVTAVPDAGYHFVQWSDGRTDNPRTDLNVAEDISVEAVFAGNTSTVTFDAQGGSAPVPLDAQVTFGSAYGLLATSSRTDYTFFGWYTAPIGGKQVSSATVVSTAKDHTLYAQWKRVPSSIPNPDAWVTNGPVYAIAQSGNIIYIGGDFTWVGPVTGVGGQMRNRMAAIDSSTGTATDWDPNSNGQINSLAVSPDGATVYAGGEFTVVGGQTRNKIVALDAATGNATVWNPNASHNVRVLTVSPDGTTVYAGGGFLNIGGQERAFIAALDSVTGAATPWNPGANNWVLALRVSSNGMIVYVGGLFTSIGGHPWNRIVAINAATGLLTSWNPDATWSVYDVVLSPDGATVYAGGGFTSIGGQPRNRVAAINTANSTATAWNPNASSRLEAVAVSPDGATVYAGGGFTSIGGQPRNNIASLEAATGIATDWNPNADYDVHALVVSEDGRSIYAGGSFTSIGGEMRQGFAQFDLVPAPGNPGATAITTDSITWTWEDESNNEVGFKVYAGAGTAAPQTVTHTTEADIEAWQHTGLEVNTRYAMQVAATYDDGDSAKTTTVTAWTLALTPTVPVVQNATATTVDVAVGMGDGNPSYTEYALYCVTTGQWVQFDGALGVSKVWRTAAEWGSITVIGLNNASLYSFRVRARNGAGVETTDGLSAPEGVNYWQLTYTAGANGVIDGNSPQLVSHGGNGTSVTAVPDANYHWVQWSDGRTDNPRTDLAVMAVVNVEAIFAGNTYTVTFNPQGGSAPVPSDTHVVFGSDYGALAVTSRTGYVFDGWFTLPAGGELVTEATVVTTTSDHTLYAQWTIRSYTLNYTSSASGTISGDPVQVVPYGGDGTSVTAVPDAGYHFVQWSDGRTDNPRTDLNVAEDISVEAVFAGNTCTVTFDPQGGSAPVPSEKQVIFGSAYGALATTSRADYTFIGWYTAPTGGEQILSTTIVSTDENHTLYAQWKWLSNSIPRHDTWVANGPVYAIAQSGNIIYIGGNFTWVGPVTGVDGCTRNRIAAIDSATGAATDWDPNSNGQINSLAVSPDGATVYAGGAFTGVGGQTRNNIVALDALTGNATAWNPNADNTLVDLTVSPDGTTVYAGGGFANIGGQARTRIAALDSVTGAATPWNPGANNWVRALRVSSDGTTVYAGGSFTSIGGQTRNRIAAINATTGLLTSWNPNANNTVFVLALSGTTVYAGGSFTSIGGQMRNRVAALNTVNSTATAWNPNASSTLEAVAVSPDGTTVYAGGGFTSIGGQPRNRIAALDAATGTATDWNPNANNYIFFLEPSGTKVYAGGSFTTIGGEPRQGFAQFRFTVEPGNPGATAIRTDSITWTWQDKSSDETGFKVYAGTGVVAPETVTYTTAANVEAWEQTGLDVNAQYAMQVATTYDDGDSAKTAAITAWTLAMTPVAPVVSDALLNTLNVSIGAGDGNPAYTEYALYCVTTDQWLQPGGVLDTAAAWQTAADWGTTLVTGLDSATLYTFYARARNGAWVETADSPGAAIGTNCLLTYTTGPNGTIQGTATQTVLYGGNGTPVTAVPALNFGFVQWSDGRTDNPRTDLNVTENITVEPIFIGNIYTVSFKARDGDAPVPADILVNYGSAYGMLATTSRTGYTFDGWFTAATGGDLVTPDTIVSIARDHKLFAAWTPNTYTVTFDAQGGGAPVPADKLVTYDSAYGVLAATSSTGYAFAGWFTAPAGGVLITESTMVSIADAHTLYAQWTPNTYTVTFDVQGGDAPMPAEKLVVYGSAYGVLAATSRIGYTFAGWFTAPAGGVPITESTMVSIADAHTLYAQWTPNTYTVTFDAQGGDAPVPADKLVTYDSAYGVLAVTSRIGYVFAGWFTAPTDGDLVTEDALVSSAGDHTVYAQWTMLFYTLTYTADGNGTIIGDSPQSVPYGGDGASVTAAANPGYRFAQWSDGRTSNPRVDANVTDFVDVTAAFVPEFLLEYRDDNPLAAVVDSRVDIVVHPINALGTIDYQWYRLFAIKTLDEIPGAREETLTMNPVTMDDEGTYVCVASDNVGTTQSPEIVLLVGMGIPASSAVMLLLASVALGVAGVKTLRRRT